MAVSSKQAGSDRALTRPSKRGQGAYWGYKRDAKKKSSRTRRKNWQREIRQEAAFSML